MIQEYRDLFDFLKENFDVYTKRHPKSADFDYQVLKALSEGKSHKNISQMLFYTLMSVYYSVGRVKAFCENVDEHNLIDRPNILQVFGDGVCVELILAVDWASVHVSKTSFELFCYFVIAHRIGYHNLSWNEAKKVSPGLRNKRQKIKVANELKSLSVLFENQNPRAVFRYIKIDSRDGFIFEFAEEIHRIFFYGQYRCKQQDIMHYMESICRKGSNVLTQKVNIQEAFDAKGNIVSVTDAQTGNTYFCPHCGIELFVNISSLGNPYFSAYPGQYHSSPECEMISMVTASSRHRYQMEKTNPKTLLKTLLTPPRPGIQPRHDNPPTEVPPGFTPQKLHGFHSLAELFDSCVCFLPPNTPMGNGVIGDCCACRESTIANIINDPFFRGEKIIYGMTEDINGMEIERLFTLIREDRPRIAFTIYTKDKETSIYRRRYLVLECNSEEELRVIFDSLYERYCDEMGRIAHRARCKKVLVAGDWRPGTCGDCPHTCDKNKRSDCHGVLLTSYVSPRQIFGIIPNEPREVFTIQEENGGEEDTIDTDNLEI